MANLSSLFTLSDSDREGLGRAMTGDEVRKIAYDGLVTIGAHTVTHPVLTDIDAAACQLEIAESKLACEALVGGPVTSFAYPFGDFDNKTREAVRTAGFTAGCVMQNNPALRTSDVLALPRVHVRNLDGDAFERTLRFAGGEV